MKKVNPIEVRNKNALTSEEDQELLFELKDFPVFIGATSDSIEDDLFSDMVFDISRNSGLIQLRNLLDPDLIYSGYHSEALGGVWLGHHQQFGELLAKYKLKNVLEIGGSNGSLAELVDNLYPFEKWTIIEPNPAFKATKKIVFKKELFEKDTDLGKLKTDCVVHSHTLEHLYDPKECLDKIFETLEVGHKHIFSIPNLVRWLQSGFPNTINFEHTLFLTEEIMDVLLVNCGFKVIEKKYYLDHSIFYVTEKVEKPLSQKYLNNYKKYRKMYLDFIKINQNSVDEYNKFIDNYSGKVYLFGGHIFSQFLVHLGLKQDKIVKILDNSKIKQGKRLYGTKLKITSPASISQLNKVAVILRAGVYTEEVTKQLREINPKVEILL